MGPILREDVDDLYGGVAPANRVVVEPDGSTTVPEPVEDALDDPQLQEPGDLPTPVTGNDMEEEVDPDSDDGEPEAEGDE